jgi:MoaA/NifB/PqqE/SkfB family radical SAM enzyme
MAVAHPLARTLERFTLDCGRRIGRLERATACLNGQLIEAGAEELVGLMSDAPRADEWPRDVTIELTARRATRGVYWPGTHLAIDRGDMPVETAKRILDRVSSVEDLRVTMGGVGDPLLHPAVREIVEYAGAAGVRAIHLETDLLGGDAAWLASSPLDVLTVHVPALSPATYRRVTGVDGLAAVMENLKVLLQSRKGRVPIVVPTFTKCRLNLEEMEAWYDQWLRAVGAAAIVGPSDCAGQIPDTACADMAGPMRRACRRLDSRMTVLSDGSVVACEEDVTGRGVMGRVRDDDLMEVWRGKVGGLRAAHERGEFSLHPLCGKCREWHRP